MAANTGPGSYSDIINVAAKPAFKDRCAYAAVVAAVAVAAEDPNTKNHAARVAYANKVMSGSFNVNAIVFAVLVNPTISAESNSSVAGENIPDGDLQFAVNSLWDSLSNVAS
jgi:hypothetical protein